MFFGTKSSDEGQRSARRHGYPCVFVLTFVAALRSEKHPFYGIDHMNHARGHGQMSDVGRRWAPACGDVMKLQVKVDGDGKIIDAKFKTFGCGSAIASSSLATEWVKGKTLDEALKIKNVDIAKELSLPPVKLHCSSGKVGSDAHTGSTPAGGNTCVL
ncbi:Iron-sulfur cluster assembly enzyme ISCU, mitochondrial [Chionoecetes opilio]|uniref:Iron-sulfur cluster assembly enzyme ISCU, mitochondrial n=1 Tax=Chionoecetes opilio TaxID=41210 RepID=A0A8J4YX59_CHIOP|nr:Iron-sulfur cluster assembly enzyme ISCU, mitochondrial [Chionoecetes opilio]